MNGLLTRGWSDPESTVWQHFDTVSTLLDNGEVDAADAYLADVREREGDAVYESVCSKIAKDRGIPPKDIPRPIC